MIFYRLFAQTLCLSSILVFFLSPQGTAQTSSPAGARRTKENEAEIRKIIEEGSFGEHTAADLDWENVFGVRFNKLQDLRKFVTTGVAKLSTPSTTNDQLETRLHFISPTIAVVDVYSHLVGQIDQNTGKPGADRWIRNTYVVTKSKRQWTVVLQRIADLRSPWYQHLAALPSAATVFSATLASYTGLYQAPSDSSLKITAVGDHLIATREGVTGIAIPSSESEFLYFRDQIPVNNSFWRFLKAPDGTIQLIVSGAHNDHPTTYTKQ